jgi:hypothetical protein
MTLVINSRDKQSFQINLDDLFKMESFMIKNLVEDTDDTSELEIDEDSDIIKNIIDSLRYRKLIFKEDTNLRLMMLVCDKWCVPQWLITDIYNEISSSKKLTQLNTFIDNLTNNIYKCKNCGVGFNKFNNKANSCKYHPHSSTLPGPDNSRYGCCNKEEPCKIGYHVVDLTALSLVVHRVGELNVL